MSIVESIKNIVKKHFKMHALVSMVFALVMLVGYIIYINFSYYWDFLHSDIATDLAFIREAARQMSLFPTGWSQINEMRLIYITTPAILFYLITGNVHLAYSLATSFMFIVNIALFYYMISVEKRNIFATIGGIFVFLAFFSRNSMFSIFSILFINGSLSTHLATIFLTIGVYLRVKFNTEEESKGFKFLKILTILLAFTQGIQSPRMIVAIYAPLLFVELLPLLSNVDKEEFKINEKGVLYALIAFSFNGLGMVFVNYLVSHGVIAVAQIGRTTVLNIAHSSFFIDRTFSTANGVFEALGLFGNSEIFGTDGLVFVIRLAFLFVVLLLYKKIKKDALDKNLVNLLFATVVFNFFAQALTFMGMGERFNFTLTSLIAVIFVLTFHHVVENLSHYQPQKYIITGMVALLLSGAFLSLGDMRMERNPSLINYRLSVIDFLKEEGLTVGYGYFWQALSLAAFSDWEIQMISLNSGILGPPIPQGVSYDVFHHDEDRVFLLAPLHLIEDAYDYVWMRDLLLTGERHDFPWGWVIYIFDYNPWANMK